MLNNIENERVNYKITKKGNFKKVVIKYYPTEEECKGLINYHETTGSTISELISEKINDTISGCLPIDEKKQIILEYPYVYLIDEVNKWIGIITHKHGLYITDLMDNAFEAHLLINVKRKQLGLSKKYEVFELVVKL